MMKKKKGEDVSRFENRIRVGVFQSFPVSGGVRKIIRNRK
jgi:hypothetical protein